jgi:hypothetical protein
VAWLASQFVEQRNGAPGRDGEPSGEMLGRGRAVGVHVAGDQAAKGRLPVVGPEAGQPAVRVDLLVDAPWDAYIAAPGDAPTLPETTFGGAGGWCRSGSMTTPR